MKSLSSLENLRKYRNKDFIISYLGSALFHSLDVEKFESDHPELFPNTPLAQSRKRIAELEDKLQEVQRENENLKAKRGDAGATLFVCATCKAESPTVADWTQDVECAVRLTAQLMMAGEKGCTAFHEAEWKALRGGTRKRAFEAFRRALPPDLKEADPKQK